MSSEEPKLNNSEANINQALTGEGTGTVSDPLVPVTSPTLNRANRLMLMFSPSLATALATISRIVVPSSLI